MNALDTLASSAAERLSLGAVAGPKPDRPRLENEGDSALLAKLSFYNTKKKKWEASHCLHAEPSETQIDFNCMDPFYSIDSIQPTQVIELNRGGTIKIWRRILDEDFLQILKEEMLTTVKFRRYKIQGGYEPRVHCLYHTLATDDESAAQPGYRYGQVTLKARPLQELPFIEILSDVLAKLCNVHEWNIGINPICYRNGEDKIGKHADNDQGECVISTVVVDGPQDNPRRLVIEPLVNKKQVNYTANDERIELCLRPGDVYQMDEEMQKHYVHFVPTSKDSNESNGSDTEDQRRLAIVFRDGNFKKYERDNGEPVRNLKPDPKLSYRFGGIENLRYKDVCRRLDLMRMGAHLGMQRSISGSSSTGCDALIMSGARDDGLEWDCIFHCVYAVESARGAKALLASFRDRRLVRVFRSSRLDASITGEEKSGQYYRYDGLYAIISVKTPDNPKDPYLFFLAMAHLNLSGANVYNKGNPTSSFEPRPTNYEDRVPEKPNFLGSSSRLDLAQFDKFFQEAKANASEQSSMRDIYFNLVFFTYWPESLHFQAPKLSQRLAPAVIDPNSAPNLSSTAPMSLVSLNIPSQLLPTAFTLSVLQLLMHTHIAIRILGSVLAMTEVGIDRNHIEYIARDEFLLKPLNSPDPPRKNLLNSLLAAAKKAGKARRNKQTPKKASIGTFRHHEKHDMVEERNRIKAEAWESAISALKDLSDREKKRREIRFQKLVSFLEGARSKETRLFNDRSASLMGQHLPMVARGAKLVKAFRLGITQQGCKPLHASSKNKEIHDDSIEKLDSSTKRSCTEKRTFDIRDPAPRKKRRVRSTRILQHTTFSPETLPHIVTPPTSKVISETIGLVASSFLEGHVSCTLGVPATKLTLVPHSHQSSQWSEPCQKEWIPNALKIPEDFEQARRDVTPRFLVSPPPPQDKLTCLSTN